MLDIAISDMTDVNTLPGIIYPARRVMTGISASKFTDTNVDIHLASRTGTHSTGSAIMKYP
jgi:hypothetical protein